MNYYYKNINKITNIQIPTSIYEYLFKNILSKKLVTEWLPIEEKNELIYNIYIACCEYIKHRNCSTNINQNAELLLNNLLLLHNIAKIIIDKKIEQSLWENQNITSIINITTNKTKKIIEK